MNLEYYSEEEVQKIGNDICSKCPETFYITRFGKDGWNCVVIPDRYLPDMNNEDVVSWNFSCAMLKGHPYFMMSFINDRTGQKKFVSLVFCPIRYYFEEKFRSALKEFVLVDNETLSSEPRGHNLVVLSESMDYIMKNCKTKQAFLTMSKMTDCPLISTMHADIKPLRIFVEYNNEMGGKGLMTDIFIKNTSIDACVDCKKGKELLEKGSIPIMGKDIVLTPDQQEFINGLKDEVMQDMDNYVKGIR
jgi:hypothetical protein